MKRFKVKKIKIQNTVNHPQSFSKRNRFFCVSSVLLAISVIIYVVSRFSVFFAELVSKYFGGGIRFVLSGITSWFPFSFGEVCILLLVPVLIIFLFFAPDKDEGKYMTKNSFFLLGVLFLIGAIYLSAFAPCYFRTSVGEHLSLDREKIKTENVVFAAGVVSSEIEKLEDGITSDHTGKTLLPYSYSELVSKLNKAYEEACDKYDFLSDFYSRPKPLAISKLMPYTRISGFYTFFSGEANVSTAYPDYMLPFTMAHEMAHQRGIAREDEANFIAFLVCMESDDDYIKYSGYTEILTYLADSLYMVDYKLYEEVYNSAPVIYKNEYKAYVSFMRATESKSVSNITLTINDSMLQSQGQEAGSESYGLVTELVSAYYMEKME